MGEKKRLRKINKRIKRNVKKANAYQRSQTTIHAVIPKRKLSTVKTIVLVAALLPVVIAFTIATMAVSYMLVPLGIVMIVGTVLYHVVKANH